MKSTPCRFLSDHGPWKSSLAWNPFCLEKGDFRGNHHYWDAQKVHDHALSLFEEDPFKEVCREEQELRLYVDRGASALPHVLRLLDQAQIPFETIQISFPSLNDVFLKKTGRLLREES